MDRASAKMSLLAARSRAAALLLTATEEFDGIVAAAVNANADDEHDPEGSTLAFERARVAAVRAGVARQIEELDQALGRLRSGAYGRCEECDNEIAAERLTALPTTRRCAPCAGGRIPAKLSARRPEASPAARSRREGTRVPR